MKKTILSFFAILFLFVLFTGCENSKSKPNQDDEQNDDSLITTDDPLLNDFMTHPFLTKVSESK